ncbi:DUF4190 domain-containing protein [Demequina soli]|uniref:DUF4190 domain-containing protein n=1 Tax=Demequina soli TaxID=1638987 RepID=UPI000781BC51|nr:DUF4190 domain-containing protein [Demequina soli]
MVDTVEQRTQDESAPAGGDGLGIAAFVTGCVGLGPVAVVLGLLGLSRVRGGVAMRRAWPLAGLVLGIVGTLGWIAIAVAVASGGGAEREALAEVDAVNIGNAIVAAFDAHPSAATVDVAVADAGYTVAGTSVPAELDGARTLDYQGTDAYSWCVTLTADEGAVTASYDAATGLVGACPAS